MTVDSPRSKLVVTSSLPGRFPLSGVTVAPGPNALGLAVITLTALDAADFKSPGRVLITATGSAENTGTRWKDAAKESVGRVWGQRPSRVEGIPAAVTLPVPRQRVKAWALDERGARKAAVPVGGLTDEATLVLDPSWKTLWYEVEVGR